MSKKLNIVILSRREDTYTTRRLIQAAKERGHHVQAVDTLRCYMNITAQHPSIHYRGESLHGIDVVIPRISNRITFYGAAVLRQFEMMGVVTINDSLSLTRSRDKLRSLQLLSKRGVGLPITGFADSPDDINDLISMVGGPPLIIKLLEGMQGIGVVLAETAQAATSVIEAFLSMKTHILVQEYIKEADGEDIRCFVIGKKVVAAMKRKAPRGDFRANIHRGGHATLVKITPEERDMAIRAAQVLGLNIAGVDLIRSNQGPLVMEVNSSPGLEGIETTTKKDIASLIIQYCEQVHKHPHKQNVPTTKG